MSVNYPCTHGVTRYCRVCEEKQNSDAASELAIALSRAVHDRCSDVPHDIGITLTEVINDYSERNSARSNG